MAVATFTTWADTTEQTVLAAACRVTAIEIARHAEQANEVYLQLFDVANPTPGTTAPRMVLPVPTVAVAGGGNSPHIYKYIFPGGLRFGTACTAFCSTTDDGATAPTTTSLPPRIRVFFAQE